MAKWFSPFFGGLCALCGLLFQLLGYVLGLRLLRTGRPTVERGVLETTTPPSDAGTAHPIAVVIPAVNEAAVLPKTLSHLFRTCTLPSTRGVTEPTVIVVDASSKDGSEPCLARLTASHPTLRMLRFPFPSRGAQQNFGAQHASAPILLFLHADTLLPVGWDATILATLCPSAPPALGTFSLSLPSPVSFPLRLMLLGATVRARYGGLPYGDQAYFLTKPTFDSVGGFPNVPIMEDIGLLRKIRQKGGRVAVLEDRVVTSPRRWIKNGVVWNTILNQLLVLAWLCGVKPDRIYTWYYGRPPLRRGIDASDLSSAPGGLSKSEPRKFD